METLIDRLEDALRREFPFLNGPQTGEHAFRNAAKGIVEKMGLEEHPTFPGSEPLYRLKEEA